METQEKVEKGICFISFDGGGPGTISQLLIIYEFMTRLAFELNKDEDELYPADYFDLMGGVGFGGFAALLLGRLRMTLNEAMKELSIIATATFPKVSDENVLPETNTIRLRESIKRMLQRYHYPVDIKLRNDSTRGCKVVVFAATAYTMTHCHPFRTYRSRHRSPDCTFVEAACAIMASPEFFSPVAIGPSLREQLFSGIPYGFYNPMREVFQEARRIFGDDKKVSLVLSVGSGQQAVLSNSEQHTTLLTRFTSDCDTVARELSHQLSSAGTYLRLSVDKGMENIQPSDWHSLGSIIAHTDVYLQMSVITTHIDEATQWLLKGFSSVTLGELIGTRKGALVKFQPQHLSDQLAMEVKQMSTILQQGIERIILVDAVGNRIPIPMQLCRTYSLLAGIIRSYFEDQRPPGSSLVKRGRYQLISGTQREVVESAEWTNIVGPGLTVEMSMILHDRDKQSRSCPRCNRVSGGAKDQWATWKVSHFNDMQLVHSHCSVSCHLQFRITDQITSGDILVSPAVRMSENTSVPTASDMEERAYEADEQRRFRLISVINYLNASYHVTGHLRNQGSSKDPTKVIRPRSGQKRSLDEAEGQTSLQPGPQLPPVKRVKTGQSPPTMSPSPISLLPQISPFIRREEIRTAKEANDFLAESFKKAEEQAATSQSQNELDLEEWLSQIIAPSVSPGTAVRDWSSAPARIETVGESGGGVGGGGGTALPDVMLALSGQTPDFGGASLMEWNMSESAAFTVVGEAGPLSTARGDGLEVSDFDLSTFQNDPQLLALLGKAHAGPNIPAQTPALLLDESESQIER